MIQEKDFLYRVPVKTTPITTPRGQIRNPEILVDLEGGEFMHGNILDANSTNKLINQSVKDAVDDKFIENGYVTKDLLEAETSARTKGDEDLSAKIKEEQTRAEGKEKEISDKLAIVDGDSNTEGSFRKAIADVIAAAPEDLDTLKEIADKLAGNDDLHTALNQAITEKADASALTNEVTRATGAESGLQAAINAKQDAGNYIPYDASGNLQYDIYKPLNVTISNKSEGVSVQSSNISGGSPVGAFYINREQLYFIDFQHTETGLPIKTTYSIDGITSNKYNDCLATSDGIFKPISDFVLKTELPTVPTKTSQLTNDSNFITANHISDSYLGFEKDLKIYREDTGNTTTISHTGINFETDINDVAINEGGFFVSRDSDDAQLCSFTPSGIKFANKTNKDIPTANGDFVSISDFATQEDISSLRVDISKKQNKITVNEVDVTDIETADITKLRTIVTNLINALSASDLIRETETLE